MVKPEAKGPASVPISAMVCGHCGRSGHSVERCWTKFPHLKEKAKAAVKSVVVSTAPLSSAAHMVRVSLSTTPVIYDDMVQPILESAAIALTAKVSLQPGPLLYVPLLLDNRLQIPAIYDTAATHTLLDRVYSEENGFAVMPVGGTLSLAADVEPVPLAGQISLRIKCRDIEREATVYVADLATGTKMILGLDLIPDSVSLAIYLLTTQWSLVH